MNAPGIQSSQHRPPGILALTLIFALFMALRILTWSNTFLLEDHDSVLYINQIEVFSTFDSQKIFELSPDTTPFYPFVGALLSLPGFSAETAARLCSLLFSIGVFIACVQILRRVSGPAESSISLAILAASPFMIGFSVSILSEPTYVGVVYLGLWYFLVKHKEPGLAHAVGLGLVFGLTFLNRVEGLLFLALIPLLQGIYFVSKRYSLTRFLKWSAIYATTFVIVAAPQIAVVSEKMDRFALNGREVWAQLLLAPDAGSYDEEIYGLDYSATEINLTYLQRINVDEASTSSLSPMHIAESVLRNIDKFYVDQIGKLGGAILVAYFLLGLVALCRKKRFFEATTLLVFLGAVWSPGLIAAPIPRAMAVGVPILIMLSGPGILLLSSEINQYVKKRRLKPLVPASLLGVLAIAWAVPFFGMYLQQKRENLDYSLVELAPVEQIIRQEFENLTVPDIVIASRKQYLAYLTDTSFKPLPYAGIDALVTYCHANDVNFLFLQHRQTEDFPFTAAFRQNEISPDFELIYSNTDRYGSPIELYRVK